MSKYQVLVNQFYILFSLPTTILIEQLTSGGGVAQLAEHRASNQKVAKTLVDFRCSSASLYPWERHLILFPILRTNSLPVVVAQPGERHANRTASVLECYDRHTA